MSRPRCVIAILICSIPMLGRAQAPPDLVQAARARDQAIDKIDVATWDRLTAPDFTVVLETGRLVTRAERIVEFKKQKPVTTPSVCAQERIVMFANGNAATRRCVDGGIQWLEVWAKSPSGWQTVAVQGTPTAK
jgi:hypothetical protein